MVNARRSRVNPQADARAAISEHRLRDATARVLMRVAWHCRGSGECWARVETLAKACDCSPRTVKRVLAHLQRLGVVARHRSGPRRYVTRVLPAVFPELHSVQEAVCADVSTYEGCLHDGTCERGADSHNANRGNDLQRCGPARAVCKSGAKSDGLEQPGTALRRHLRGKRDTAKFDDSQQRVPPDGPPDGPPRRRTGSGEVNHGSTVRRMRGVASTVAPDTFTSWQAMLELWRRAAAADPWFSGQQGMVRLVAMVHHVRRRHQGRARVRVLNWGLCNRERFDVADCDDESARRTVRRKLAQMRARRGPVPPDLLPQFSEPPARQQAGRLEAGRELLAWAMNRAS